MLVCTWVHLCGVAVWLCGCGCASASGPMCATGMRPAPLLILGGPAGQGYDSCLAGQSRRLACAGLIQMPKASSHRDRASWLCISRLVWEGSVGGQPQTLGCEDLSLRPVPPQEMLRQHSLLLTLWALLSLGSGEFCGTFLVRNDGSCPPTLQEAPPWTLADTRPWLVPSFLVLLLSLLLLPHPAGGPGHLSTPS